MGDECGTSAISPRRRAPSSILSSVSSTSRFLRASKWIHCPAAKVNEKSSTILPHHGKRLRRFDPAYAAIGMRRGEDLFRRDIRHILDAVRRLRRTANPLMSIGKMNMKIRA